jgi:hypothetical protein
MFIHSCSLSLLSALTLPNKKAPVGAFLFIASDKKSYLDLVRSHDQQKQSSNSMQKKWPARTSK